MQMMKNYYADVQRHATALKHFAVNSLFVALRLLPSQMQKQIPSRKGFQSPVDILHQFLQRTEGPRIWKDPWNRLIAIGKNLQKISMHPLTSLILVSVMDDVQFAHNRPYAGILIHDVAVSDISASSCAGQRPWLTQ